MSASMESGVVRKLFGIPIDAVTMDQALSRIDDAIAGRGRLQIAVVNAAKIVNMRRDRALRDDVMSSDLILADGMSVVWASRLLGRPLPERVAGIDLMFRILRRGDEQGYRVYCLGATQAVLDKAVAYIATEYSNVTVVGRHDGYFTRAEEPAIATEIAAAQPDVLLVAMTSPKKEQFLARWSDRLGVPVCHGVGGSFDVLAGLVRRAPAVWQRAGFEWLYRLIQEPGRLWRRYLFTNTIFCGLIIAEAVQRLHRRRGTIGRGRCV
jgi:N-acetylglucosaminyldiphosphoundecaprenol N-acetyl-beta-D-mannosaminyltransferase